MLTLLIAAIAALGSGAGQNAAGLGFSARIDNPWYPLRPGTTYVYRGIKDGKRSRDVFTVTHRIRRIDGALCVVVEDRLYLNGRLGERTTEWFSQDRAGNVWYFGEDTADLDASGAVISRSGSWRAGVRGARPGIFMFADPQVGQAAQQEFSQGRAEDHFRIIGVFSRHALLTEEWTPLEPHVVDHKLYVRGVGTVLEQTERGGSERAELVAVKTG